VQSDSLAQARLAFAEGDPEQAARLAGAAEGLRQRVGLHVWPMLRRREDQLAAQVHTALGADRFDQAFSAGFRLNEREAVSAVRDRRGASTKPPQPTVNPGPRRSGAGDPHGTPRP